MVMIINHSTKKRGLSRYGVFFFEKMQKHMRKNVRQQNEIIVFKFLLLSFFDQTEFKSILCLCQ